MIDATVGSPDGRNLREGPCSPEEGVTAIARLLWSPTPATRIVTFSNTMLVIEDDRDPAAFIRLFDLPYKMNGLSMYCFTQGTFRFGGVTFEKFAMSVVGFVLLQPEHASDEARAFVVAKVAAMSA